MTETVTLNTQILFGAEDAFIETFEVPASRSVHSKSFPLGIKPRDNTKLANVDDAAEYIAKLAEEGVFNSLLTNRLSSPIYSPPCRYRTANEPQMVLFCSVDFL